MFYPKIAGAFILILLVGTAASAQQSNCRERTIPFSVFIDDGFPVRNLEDIKLEASYKGKALLISSDAAATSRPLHIVLLVDISGSMRGEAATADWNLPLDVANDLLAKMPATAEIGIAFFTTELQHVVRPTADHQKLIDEVKAVRQSRNEKWRLRTGLWDAVRNSLELLGPPQAWDVVYVITDGLDNASKTTPQRIAQILGAAGIRLFTFVLADKQGAVSAGPYEKADQDQLQEIVDDTAGRQIVTLRPSIAAYSESSLADKAGNPTGLTLLLNAQFQQIVNVHLLTIELPEPVDRPRKWRLGVVGTDKAKKNNLRLVYPEKLLPCDRSGGP